MITFVPRDTSSKNWFIIGPVLSIFFTIIFGLLIFTFLGYSPIETLYQIFISPFSRIVLSVNTFSKLKKDWRRERDSNSRDAINAYTRSRRAHSTTLPPLRISEFNGLTTSAPSVKSLFWIHG